MFSVEILGKKQKSMKNKSIHFILISRDIWCYCFAIYLLLAFKMASSNSHLVTVISLCSLLPCGIRLINISIKITWKWLCVNSETIPLKKPQLLFYSLGNPATMFGDTQASLERPRVGGTEPFLQQPTSACQPHEWATLAVAPHSPG